MRRLTTFIAVIFAAAAFAPLRAQSLDAFKERLAAPVVSDAAFGTARVTVTEYGDAEKAVDDASRVGQRLRLRGYRVCIFFDNGQDARAGAFAAEALFKETYPCWQANYIEYDWAGEDENQRIAFGANCHCELCGLLAGSLHEWLICSLGFDAA